MLSLRKHFDNFLHIFVSGSCVFVALAILAGNRRKVHTLVSAECQCEETRGEMGQSVKMALVAGIAMIAAACLLGSVYIAGLSKRERNGNSGEKDGSKTITKVMPIVLKKKFSTKKKKQI